jgi:hypothetical protein
MRQAGYKIERIKGCTPPTAVHFAHRVKKRIVSLAVLGIVGWLFAFAAHLHVADHDDGASSTHAHHACLLCAAMQPGAGAAPEIASVAAGETPRADSSVVLPPLRQQAHAFYRSRAPPRA